MKYKKKFEQWWRGYFHEIDSQKDTAFSAYSAAKQDSAVETARVIVDNIKLRKSLEAIINVIEDTPVITYQKIESIAKEALDSTITHTTNTDVKIFSRKTLQYHDDALISKVSNDYKRKIMSEWRKHDETMGCPTEPNMLIEVETWAAKGSYLELASNLDWRYVKFYREIPTKK